MTGRLCIINTGGTIGMRAGPRGLEAAPGYLEAQLAAMPELADPAMPAYDVHQYDPVLDSSNLTPSDWLKLARDIEASYADFDAFVILHGTDTMAYTASALPLMLPGLGKTVVLTGAQLPLCMLRNDARENLITAMMIASRYRIPEVTLYFGGKLLRGCRATKINTSSFEAFDSPNYPPLGTAGARLTVHYQHVRPAPRSDEPLVVRPIEPAAIGTFRLFPGMSIAVLENVLRPPLAGLVLETFGVGNGPSRNREFLAALAAATARGVVIVNTTQCRFGCVSQEDYATGKALADVGVVSGRDMTTEAALVKLMFLMSQGWKPDQIRQRISENMVGELTADGPN